MTFFRASPRAPASSALSSTTSRPPPSSGTRITMPRPSLTTSSGPSPVRGFIAAMRIPLPADTLTCPIIPHDTDTAKRSGGYRFEDERGRVSGLLPYQPVTSSLTREEEAHREHFEPPGGTRRLRRGRRRRHHHLQPPGGDELAGRRH